MQAPRVFASAISKSAFLFSDCHGSVAVVAALLFPVLIGGMGLGAEVGYWYVTQRKLQHAADASAYAAVVRLKSGDGQTKLEAAGLFIAKQSGFRSSIGTMALHHPPTSGPNAGDSTMVEVVLTEALPRYFTGLFKDGSVQIRARSVAKNNELNVCVLALSPNANNAVQVAGSSNPAFVNCTVVSNSTSSSSIRLQGNASSLSAACAYASGGYQGPANVTTTACEGVVTNSPAIQDPYENVSWPTAMTACLPGNVGSNNVNTAVTADLTLPNGWKYKRYCSLSPQGHVTFGPGLYIVDGDMTSTGQTISGSGVTFAVGGNVSLSGSLTVTLSPPNTGPYSGLLFFGDRDAAAEGHTLTGDLASVYQGAIYFPTGNLTFTGSSNVSNGCTQVIAKTITFTGSSTVRAECANVGVTTLTVGAAKIALSE